MNNIMDSVTALRESLYVQLTDTLLRGVIDDVFTPEESKEISRFILSKLEKVKTKDEMLLFLHDLSTKWAKYNPFYVKLKYENQKKDDEAKMDEIKSKLNQFMSLSYGRSRSN